MILINLLIFLIFYSHFLNDFNTIYIIIILHTIIFLFFIPNSYIIIVGFSIYYFNSCKHLFINECIINNISKVNWL